MSVPDGRDGRWPAALDAVLGDRYEPRGALGRGGMATVHRAWDVQLQRVVAVKVMLPSVSAAMGAARFRREIRIVGALAHPGIIPLLDAGEADGLLWYIMPCVEGGALRARLAREGALPVAETLRLAGELARALDFAHGRAVLHRDVKPENILLMEGRAVIADFGLARALGESETTRLTFTGDRLGTVQYMSPEQLRAEDGLDPRTDVYGLGCVLFEMLAGAPAYSGPSLHELVRRIILGPLPSLRAHRTGLPAALEEVVHTALAKSAEDRFPSAAAFAEALRGSPAHGMEG